ncbi:MAG: ABC transporter permease subunit [Hyphomicrobiaceae bacterium]
MLRRSLAALAIAFGLSGAATTAWADTNEVNFGIISTESSANLKVIWEPFLADVQKSIRATGTRSYQEVIFGIVPQVMPLWSSFTLYRFETNVRSATVLGIVGAGGIGQSLYENIRSFQYSETAAIIIIIVLTVSLIDLLSAQVRKLLV